MTRRVLSAAVCLLSALALRSGAQAPARLPHPVVRVTGKIDRNLTHTLKGTHPGAVERAAVGSRVDASTQLNGMILVLQPSGEQEAALHTLLDAQQDKGSASFHKWLTPDDFAASFGVAPADIARVSAWLTESGLSVGNVSRSGRFITFSGTVGTVETAFGTEIHNVTVGGEQHIANTTDISIPAALAPVVSGVKSLNNFFPRAKTTGARKIALQRNPVSGFDAVDPEFGGSATGTHYVAPGDLATIFNAGPLTAKGIDGTGVTISVLARSNIQLADVEAYRSLFGLPKNDPNTIVVGSDPGENTDDIEAFLDAELAGSLATGAKVNFIVSGASLIGSGIDTAGLYAVDNNSGDIITLSYGSCETANGAAGTAFWSDLWEEAAAQGQTAFVSTGDSNAAGCDSSGAAVATAYGVNALGSSAYNVAVGGSMFADFNPSQFWGTVSGIPYASALGYIPEAAWNQGRFSTTYLNATATATQPGSGIAGGGGGISIYTARPSWQTGSGIPVAADAINVYSGTGIAAGSPITGPHRLMPDVSFIAASGHDGTLFCYEGGCYENAAGGLVSAGVVGGTSVAAPAMASVQALIDAANGGRQGNANIFYYALANQQYTASAASCQAPVGTATNPAVTLPASTCNFHDIVAGSNIAPTAATGTAGLGFSSGPGFDEASGLGSVNIANVAGNWSSVKFNATATTLSLTPATGTHGLNQTASIQVTPASGSGTPSGDVSIIASEESSYGAPQVFTLSAGSVTGLVNSLPAGSYSVYAHYAGDGTFASSDSAPVAVTIGKEAATTNLYPYLVTAAGNVNPATSFSYGAGEIYLDTEIYPGSGNGTAGGSVLYTIARNGAPLPSLTSKLDTYGDAYMLSGPPYSDFYLVPNYATLTPGTYTVTAAYSGDTSFTASSSSTTLTVLKATPAVSLTTSTAQINPGGFATLNFRIATPASAAPASGTVQFIDTSSVKPLGSATLSNGVATFTTSSMIFPGVNSITANYTGDGNYNGATATTAVTVGSTGATTTTVTSSTAAPFVGTAVSLSAAVSPVPSVAAPVSFYDSGRLLGTANVSTVTGTASLLFNGFTAGVHTLSATYAGTSTGNTSTGFYTLPVARNITSVDISGGETSTYGQTVSFNGYVLRSPNMSGAPAVPLTGTVNFTDNGNLLGTVAPAFAPGANRYVATLNIATLAPGSHHIVASYAGDANYAASSSVAAPLTVTNGTVRLNAVGEITGSAASSYAVTVTVTNTGTGLAQGVLLTGVAVGGAVATPPSYPLGNIEPGASAKATVNLPGIAGADGQASVEKIIGSYTGGTFGGALRVTLP